MPPERLEELLSLLEASVRRPLVRWPGVRCRVAAQKRLALLSPSLACFSTLPICNQKDENRRLLLLRMCYITHIRQGIPPRPRQEKRTEGLGLDSDEN